MSSERRAVDNAIEERPVQRPRLHGGGDIETPPLSLDDVNDHCILEVFKCLSAEDLNSIAVFISSRYRDLRNHDSLNQTRTGTIVCTENTTIESITEAFAAQEWDQVFAGNRTRLKVIGLERMPRLQGTPLSVEHMMPEFSPEHLLPNVTCLDLSYDPLADNRNVQTIYNVNVFPGMLPNLEEIDFSYMIVRRGTFISFDGLQKIIWNGSQREFSLDFGSFDQITELHLDDSLFHSALDPARTRRVYSYSTGRRYMLSGLANIVSLSIKNATFFERGELSAFPVVQRMLLKMVRRHPTLRWLRSDLTEENIAMLKRERPEITFVSD